jgi:hypothetical protein
MAASRQPYRRNPFKPTAGMNPPELIGRSDVLERFAESLENGPGAPDRLMRIAGVRGVGKTALLNALGNVAEQQGFRVVNVAASPGFMGRITSELGGSFSVGSVSIAPEAFGVKAGSLELVRAASTMTNALRNAAKKGLLITVDEVQDAPYDEMRAFGNEIQLLVREGADIALAFAGLPDAVDRVVGGKGLTFLRRASQISLERLHGNEVSVSLAQTFDESGVAISADLAGRLAEASAGYPFMVQLVGYHTWQGTQRRSASSVEMRDVERGIAVARRSFDSMVIEPALRQLPKGQLTYLLAMAHAGEGPVASGTVAQLLGKQANQVSTHRKRLIEANVIEPAGFGNVTFTIPCMRDWLLEHGDALEEDLYPAV